MSLHPPCPHCGAEATERIYPLKGGIELHYPCGTWTQTAADENTFYVGAVKESRSETPCAAPIVLNGGTCPVCGEPYGLVHGAPVCLRCAE